MASVKEATEKPSIDDFKLGRQLGEGNFSRIMVATHVATGEEFALKVIEKQRIKRLKVRHPNIFNEINMEKEVLNKVRHANVIRLYQTFQDETNLYFLLEHLEGGELLTQLLHEGHQVGLHEDLARFYLADVVNAVDFLHENGIMHRDLKPENMVLSAKDGHLRLIDFGTAKDLADTALNGPNFVGTPEYMAPETVDNKDATYAGDVWAFGCVMFQLLAGETPFSGGSVYLTLLKVQSGKYTVPAFLSESAKDLIHQCLQPDPELRPSMKAIKGHVFFQDIDFTNHMRAPPRAVKYANVALFDLIRELHDADKARQFQQPLTTTDDEQPKIDTLDEHDRALLMHLLERKQLLHLTSVYPRFFASPSRGRCLQARNGGYIGLTHNLQNQWSDTYSFMMVGGPCFRGGVDRDADIANFRARVVQPINAHSPAFVVFCGDILGIKPDNDGYNDLAAYFQTLIGEIHPEVKLVFVPGMKTFESSVDESARAAYTSQFGDDCFSFWYGGVKFIVINSSLFAHESTYPEQAKEHEDWLAKELDNGKLCARETVLLSAHSFHSSVQGPELPPHLAATQPQVSNQDHQSGVPAALKKRIVELLGKNPVRLIVTTEGPGDRVTVVQTTRHPNASAEEEDEAIAVKKTEMVVCTSPIDTAKANAVIHVVNVAQSGITVSQLKTPLDMPKALSAAAPEDIDITLATEGAKLEISRDVATA